MDVGELGEKKKRSKSNSIKSLQGIKNEAKIKANYPAYFLSLLFMIV